MGCFGPRLKISVKLARANFGAPFEALLILPSLMQTYVVWGDYSFNAHAGYLRLLTRGKQFFDPGLIRRPIKRVLKYDGGRVLLK